MPLLTCPDCGEQLVSSAAFCGNCGHRFPAPEPPAPPPPLIFVPPPLDPDLSPEARFLVLSRTWQARPHDYSSLIHLNFYGDRTGEVVYGYGQRIYAKIRCEWVVLRRRVLRLTYLPSPWHKGVARFTLNDWNRVKEVSYTLTEGEVTGIESIVGWPYKFLWTLTVSGSPWPDRVTLPGEAPRTFYGYRQQLPAPEPVSSEEAAAELRAWVQQPLTVRDAQQASLVERLRELSESQRFTLLIVFLPLPYYIGPLTSLAALCLDSVEAHEGVALRLLRMNDPSYAKYVARYLLPLTGPHGVIGFLRRHLDTHPTEVSRALYHVPSQFGYQFGYEDDNPLHDPEVRTDFKELVATVDRQGALEFDPVTWAGRRT